MPLEDRFHLIIPEIGILFGSFGNQVSEFLLPFNHLYQPCSGPGLREVPVGTFQLSGSRKMSTFSRPLPFNNSWNSENRVSKSRIEFPALASI